ncbi:hypothetical protein GJAV_G00152650 [Gymnothorax javanicus]|nr:hypothetical protein GJAV_G00152650 [Gymnothorax javanicus]
MVSHGCLSVIKYFLFLFNLFFFIFGLLLLSLGLWIVFDETSFFMPAPNFISFSLLSYFLAIGGTVTMTLGFFGCLGALKEVKCMLGMYFFLLTVLLAGQIIGGVLFFTQNTTLEDKVGEYVQQLISSIRVNNSSLDHIKTLNYIQTEENCCGWNGPQDWTGVKVPCSCYQPANSSFLDKLPQVKGNSSQNTCLCHSLSILQNNYTCSIHQKGCKEGITKWLKSNMVVILSTWFAVVVVELFGMTLSMSLYRKISVDYGLLTRYS